MRRPVLWFTSVIIGFGLLTIIPTCLITQTDAKPAILAALSNWFPGVWSLRLADKSRKLVPILQIAILLGLSFVRLGLAVVTGALGWYLISDLHDRELELLLWGCAFYVVSLITGTILIHDIVSSQGGFAA